MFSVIYTTDGDFLKIPDKFKSNYFFQKNLNFQNKGEHIELQIAQKLLLQPLDNLVKVYEIIYQPQVSIKYELLDVEKELPSWQNLQPDLKKALENLHNLKYIYIDMKEDNLGYSHLDKCWKIFDFDCSGICSTNYQSWIVKPPPYFMMRDINSLENDTAGFLNRAKYKKKDIVLPVLQKIKKENLLTKYDKLAVFISFGEIISF